VRAVEAVPGALSAAGRTLPFHATLRLAGLSPSSPAPCPETTTSGGRPFRNDPGTVPGRRADRPALPQRDRLTGRAGAPYLRALTVSLGRSKVEARRRRSRTFAAPLAALLALAASGCASSPQARGVCRDERTDQRVDDAQCSRGVGGFGWWFFAAGQRYPAIGQPVSPAGGSTTAAPGSKVVRGGASVDGGTVAKGGFGRSGGGIGG